MKPQPASNMLTKKSRKFSVNWDKVQNFLTKVFFYEEDEIAIARMKLNESAKKKPD